MSSPHDLSTAAWRKSSYSNGEGGSCVEVADGFAGNMPVRDSKAPEGPTLLFPTDGWTTFISALNAGKLNGRCRTAST